MIKFLSVMLGGAVLASPAVADPYVGVEIGGSRSRANDIDQDVTLSTTPANSAVPGFVEYDDAFALRTKRGVDLDLLAGYDFGWLRLEAELGHKRSRLKGKDFDDTTVQYIDELNATLNRPSAVPDPGAPGLSALTIEDFQPESGSMRVTSLMANALVDVKLGSRFNLYGGGGYGRSWGRVFGDSDQAAAWQYMVGARTRITERVELGLKYKYFNSGHFRMFESPYQFAGNPDRITVNGQTVDQTTTANISSDVEGRWRTRNVLLSLIYNLR
jgi:opacity protein-like surface antigen